MLDINHINFISTNLIKPKHLFISMDMRYISFLRSVPSYEGFQLDTVIQICKEGTNLPALLFPVPKSNLINPKRILFSMETRYISYTYIQRNSFNPHIFYIHLYLSVPYILVQKNIDIYCKNNMSSMDFPVLLLPLLNL